MLFTLVPERYLGAYRCSHCKTVSFLKPHRQILDGNDDGLIEFHEMVFGLDIMCNGSLQQKLKLFFYMHIGATCLDEEQPSG